MLVVLFVAMAVPTAFAADIKIFDAVSIAPSNSTAIFTDFSSAIPFDSEGSTRSIYLSCPSGAVSTLSGPSNGDLLVDNFLTVNDVNVFGGENSGFVFPLLTDPLGVVGSPMEVAYTGVGPVNVSGTISTSGVYTFKLMDFGYSYGSNEVHLNTTCTQKVQICHRDNGAHPGFKTLSIGAAAIQSHLDNHVGDYVGACN